MNRSSFFILAIALTIAALGILSIYSATYQKEGELWRAIYRRQMLWVLLGVAGYLIVSNISYRRLLDWNYFLYTAMLFLLFLVFALGVVRLGAQRWLKLFWFNFQPSELAKLIIVIFFARYFSRKSADQLGRASGRFGVFGGIIIPFIFVIIPVALIVEQPDLGSGAIIVALFFALLYLTDVRMRYILLFFLAGLVTLPFLWHFMRGYQRDRLMVFLNPNIDPLGAGYTVIQSKIAIGSGGLFGKGWMGGTQSQLHFLPEAHTDFIFAALSEERGLLGSGALLVLYFLLVRKGFQIAGNTRDYFGRFLAYGISLMLALQVFINIAMNLGLAPVVGLPLPLMSYGGSSVVVTFIALGILAGIDRRRAVF